MTSEHDCHHEPITAEDAKGKYSQTVVDHAVNPRNAGSIPKADGFGHIKGPCGDTIEIWLKVMRDIITDITFWTDGCGPTIACGSIITEMAKGKTISEAQQIHQEDLLEALEGLPEDHQHCALLAANTLKAAINDYLALKKEPWKKAYRNQ